MTFMLWMYVLQNPGSQPSTCWDHPETLSHLAYGKGRLLVMPAIGRNIELLEQFLAVLILFPLAESIVNRSDSPQFGSDLFNKYLACSSIFDI